MAEVMRDDLLAAVYKSVLKNAEKIPSRPIQVADVFYRYVNPKSRYGHLTKPPEGMTFSKSALDALLTPAPTFVPMNRYTGPPCGDIARDALGNQKIISPATGLYCSLQNQALVAEAAHYTGKHPHMAFDGQVILYLKVTNFTNVADISPHNAKRAAFLRAVECDLDKKYLDRPLEEKLSNLKDCSAARGLGLAVANCRKFAGLVTETVRESERSEDEKGDNLVLFGSFKRPLPFVRVTSVLFYEEGKNAPEVFPVSY